MRFAGLAGVRGALGVGVRAHRAGLGARAVGLGGLLAAGIAGSDAAARLDVVFVEDVARLRTGRKRKHDDTQEPSEPTETLRKDLGSSADDTDSDGNVAGGGGTRSRTRGLTAREKARALFSEVGLDAAMLTGDGLDIFHLSKLGRLAECVHPSSPLSFQLNPNFITIFDQNVHRCPLRPNHP